MDSITHLFIGGAIAAAIAPAGQRRAALLAGAAINSLPDLDVLPLLLSDDPIVRMTWHRGATHSLLLLPFVAWALWLWFRQRGGRVARAPRRWFWLCRIRSWTHSPSTGRSCSGRCWCHRRCGRAFSSSIPCSPCAWRCPASSHGSRASVPSRSVRWWPGSRWRSATWGLRKRRSGGWSAPPHAHWRCAAWTARRASRCRCRSTSCCGAWWR